MNGVDLARFQFDFDMSFGVFFMNSDGTIYGRYGTRNERPPDADSQISMEGLREAMKAALSIHRGFPGNKSSLENKVGPAPRYSFAEDYPQLKKYQPKINYENQVAKSCIHCHQIHDAERQVLRDSGKMFPDEILYLYPMPQVVGIEMDPKKRATILSVQRGSQAADADLKAGDEILFADGQPLISIADFQWVLHNTPSPGAVIPLKVRRSGKIGDSALKLENGWRKRTDFSWRVSTWDLRRMALGGLSLAPDNSSRRTELGLEVKAAGKFGAHAVARKAGVLPGDKLKSMAGLSGPSTEASVIAHILNSTRVGDPIEITVIRGGRELTRTFKAQ